MESFIKSLKKYFKVIQKEPKTKFKKKTHIILDELCALKWWPLEK